MLLRVGSGVSIKKKDRLILLTLLSLASRSHCFFLMPNPQTGGVSEATQFTLREPII